MAATQYKNIPAANAAQYSAHSDPEWPRFSVCLRILPSPRLFVVVGV